MHISEEWLEAEKAMGGRATLHGSVDDIIAQFNGFIEALKAQGLPPNSPNVTDRYETIESVPIRIYTPKSVEGTPAPIGLYFHGGGYICGNLETEDIMCRAISEHDSCIIVSVNYRHAPKYKMPAMVDDGETAFKWVYAHAKELGGDQAKIFTFGNSAGGGLALSVANRLVADPSTRGHIKGVAAMVPVTLHPEGVPEEYKSMYTAFEENGKDAPLIDAGSMKTFFGELLLIQAAGVQPNDPDTFAALSKNLAHFPPCYIVSCGADPLRDDAIIMEHALKKAGAKTKIDIYPGMPHTFWTINTMPTSQQFFGNMLGGVKWVIES